MQITEVRIKLMDDPQDRLKAFCSITFDDCFVVRDLKIIEGATGPFVAMPSRKLMTHCPKCRTKNHLRAAYCNQCGVRLHERGVPKDEEGRAKLYADIAHPINSECREMIQRCVIQAFEEEQQRAQQPGYVCRYEDIDSEHAQPQPAEAEAAADAKVQPAEKPQGPHKRHETAPQQSRGRPDQFGAGILE